MPTTLSISALNRAAMALGRGTVLMSEVWDGTGVLELEHIGETEGDIVFNANEAIRTLGAPELYADGVLQAKVNGANPIATIPIYLADATKRDLLSPTGDGLIGLPGMRDVARKTLVIMPYELYYNAATGKHDAQLNYTSGDGWTKSAVASGEEDNFVALTTEETRLLKLGIWMYDGYFTRPPVTFRHGSTTEVARDIESCEFRAIVPEAEAVLGAMATIGPPDLYGIEIDVAVS